MQHKITNLSQIHGADNKRNCWSTQRVLRKCYQCKSYSHCESKIVNKHYEEWLAQLHEEEKKIREKFKKFNEAVQAGRIEGGD